MAADAATIETTVIASLVEFGADPDAIGRDATFEQLDVDSLDLAELTQIVEDEFGVEIKSSDVAELRTVGDVLDLIAARA